jgi:4-amino-4-deoxychorismate lyase
MYKCRIIYSREIETIEFIPYTKKKIEIIKLVECDAIEYNHKYFNRKIFDDLLAESGADEILIIKEGKITDTSYSNIAFYDGNKWLTPSTPLLKGTKREKLLREGKIFKAEIVKNDLQYFQSASLINAMMDLGELVIDLKILNLAQTKFCPTKILP